MSFEQLRQDVRYAVRGFGRNPFFVLIAVLSLAIGIGADTTLFTIANAILLRPPSGVTEPNRLVDISGTERDESFGVNEISFLNFADLRDRTTTLDSVCGYEPFTEPMSLAGPGGAERIFGHEVTTNYFAVHGVQAAAGRLFDTRGSEQTTAEQTVVLSERFWARRFSRDPAVIGQVISLNGNPYTIVGVAAAGFEGTSLIATDMWVPLSTTLSPGSFRAERGLRWALVRGRLKPGVSRNQAAAEIAAIGGALEQEYPEVNRGQGLRLAGASFVPGNLAIPLAGVATLMMAFVSIVLVIACSNLAGVLLARATSRRRELAVRAAIGAGRRRLISQLLTETMLLFILGGAAGLLFARLMTSVIVALMPALPMPLEVSMPLDGRTLAFTMVVSAIAALLCGLVPALQASKPDVMATLKDEAMGIAGRSRLRNAFVVAQVALSILLVIGAAIFARALQKATGSDPGFDPNGVELASIDLSVAKYTPETGRLFFSELAHHVRSIAGVRDATIMASLPTGGPSRFGRLSHPETSSSRPAQALPADWNVVEPRYFSTMRIPIVAGRDFTDADRAGAESVIIVSEEAARRYWPGQNAIGKVLLQHLTEFRRGQDNSPKAVVVIGIVRDIKPRLSESPRPQVYLPLQQQWIPRVTIAARSTNGQRLASELRQAVAVMDRTLPILEAQTLEQAARFALLPQRLGASVSGALGIVGLLLAAMGVYGVTAFAVAQRTREIGIRLAVGATERAILQMVFGFGMRLVAIGAALGLLLAIVLDAALMKVFVGFPPLDAAAFGGTALLFAGVGLAACYAPVRRAATIDPAVVLRYD